MLVRNGCPWQPKVIGQLLQELAIPSGQRRGKVKRLCLGGLSRPVENILLDLLEQVLLSRGDGKTLGLLLRLGAAGPLGLDPPRVGVLGFEEAELDVAQGVQEHAQPLHVDHTLLIDVSAHLGQHLFIDLEHESQRAFVDMQIRQVGQKVVSNKESHQNKIVNHPFHVKGELQCTLLFQLLKLQLQVLSDHTQMQKEKVLMLELLGLLGDLTAKSDLLTEEAEVGVVAQQTQHDQVSVEAVQAVADIGIVAGLCFRMPDVLHDLVLTLTRDLVARQDDLDSLPVLVLGNFLAHEVLQLFRQLGHELGTRGNAVTVEGILLGHLDTLRNRLLLGGFGVEGGPETSRALLVHLGSRGHTVDRHEEQLLGLDLAVQMLDIIKNGNEHLVFSHSEGGGVAVLVCAIVDNAVHVQI
ncbi:hypothetical protein BO70DRAFT_52842 [Aspergillus heteromorphus CBS 117.55]|uniref:Uncharacterized protein n=1 Tax=Aspergillus heteromorphus CBS 117.55 TaxID=1448321 RepID=A0A317W249_9EURO|nr:uncharacterized protein BO70DRAFT_52842 [Aspergillus heteromorphus CBS 117.55]PWY79671.1 hypothetical protein BO70DRAFT_52842 [Aspergillus heteromorphus CBS 117.55]